MVWESLSSNPDLTDLKAHIHSFTQQNYVVGTVPCPRDTKEHDIVSTCKGYQVALTVRNVPG